MIDDYSTIPFFKATITSPAVFFTPTFSISFCLIPSTERGLRNISFPISAAVFSSQISFRTSNSRSVNSISWLNDGLKFLVINIIVKLSIGHLTGLMMIHFIIITNLMTTINIIFIMIVFPKREARILLSILFKILPLRSNVSSLLPAAMHCVEPS
jgi:hypothetical protein